MDELRALATARDAEDAGPHRIDPVGCGRTDCITGWSVPLDVATSYFSDPNVLARCIQGDVDNATGESFTMLADHLADLIGHQARRARAQEVADR